MPRRRLRLLLFPLRTLLLLLLLGIGRDGTSGFPVPDLPQHQVDGVVGGSVLLTALIPPEKAVAEIEWNFQLQDDTVLAIAEFTRGDFGRPDPGDRFQQRLERANETTLRLKDLVMEDGGIYTAHVRFESAEMQKLTFRLVVAPWTPGSPASPPGLLTDKSEPSKWWKLLLVVSFITLGSYTVVWHLNELKLLSRT